MTIQGFMRTELGLKGNELMVYALIFGFTQTEKQWFTGSRQYLADWLGCSVRTVQNILDKMTAEGLLVKRKGRRPDGALCCDYQTVIPEGPSEKIALGVVKKLHLAKGKNCTRPSEKISHHNNNNINKNIYIEDKGTSPEEITERIFDYE